MSWNKNRTERVKMHSYIDPANDIQVFIQNQCVTQDVLIYAGLLKFGMLFMQPQILL